MWVYKVISLEPCHSSYVLAGQIHHQPHSPEEYVLCRLSSARNRFSSICSKTGSHYCHIVENVSNHLSKSLLRDKNFTQGSKNNFFLSLERHIKNYFSIVVGRASGFMKTIKCQDTARSRTQEGTGEIYRSSPNLMTATPGGQGGEQCQLLEGVQRQRKTGVLCLQRQAGISQGWKGGQGHSSPNPRNRKMETGGV